MIRRILATSLITTCFLISSSLGQEASAPVARNQAQVGSESGQVLTASPASQKAQAANTDAAPAVDAHRLEEADLQAQIRMAEAAEKLLTLTEAQNYIGIGNVVGLVLTLAFTGWAAISASRAAKAAQDTVGTERAWLIALRPEWVMSRDTNVSGVIYPLALSNFVLWTNSGRSPATHAQSIVQVQVLPKDSPPPTMTVGWPHETSLAVIGQNQQVTSHQLAVAGELLDLVLAETHSIYVYSAIRYQDVFHSGVTRESAATFEVFRNGSFAESGDPRFMALPTGIATAT